MKKLFLVMTGLLAVAVINAQSLEEIVGKYSEVTNQDKLATMTTIKVSGKMSTMGMEMPLEIYMKNPNKIKTVYSFQGQEMVTVFDGEKGYTVNPMMGTTEPIELTGDQLRQIQNTNLFSNQVLDYLNDGKLTFEGEEVVNGKPAFKLKAEVEVTGPVFMFIDKSSYYLVKSSATVEQMGNRMSVESYMTDYVDYDGVVLPKKTTTFANGMEAAVVSFDKIEVNIPMEDTTFKLK